MSNTTFLSKDYGFDQYREQGFSRGDVIDASEASWIVSNIGDQVNRYPFLVEKSEPGLVIKGGEIEGRVPLDMDWADAYVNSAGVFVRNIEDSEIYDWRISQAWDGLRFAGNSDGFLVEEVWMSDIRDDGIENDDGSGGIIKNSLFDGVFSGISVADKSTPASAADNTVVLDGVLIRMESFLYKGKETHFTPLKIEGDSPSLEIYDTVFAVEDPDHNGLRRQEIGWDKLKASENNFFLNLSDKPFPKDYPLPGEGWTILQGQEARDHWENARSDWIKEFGDSEVDRDVTVQDDPPQDIVDEDAPEDAGAKNDVVEPLPPRKTVEDDNSDGTDDKNDNSETSPPKKTIDPTPPQSTIEEDVPETGDDKIDGVDTPPKNDAPESEPRRSDDDGGGNFLSKFFDAILSLFGLGGDDDEEETAFAAVSVDDSMADEWIKSVSVPSSGTNEDQACCELREDEDEEAFDLL